MRFLMDPALVRIDAAGWTFLAVIGILVPIGAIRQHRRLAATTHMPTRFAIYASGMITHLLFVGMVWVVVRGGRVPLFPSYHLTPAHALVGAAALGIGVLPLLTRLGRNSDRDARVMLIAPRTRGELGAFYALSISAGVAEEVTYRGLLFTLLAALTRSWIAAALLSAALFGIGHLFQGWRAAGIAALIGLRDQLVVGLTGTLVVAMMVHALHDAITGTVISRRARRERAATPDAAASLEAGIAVS